MIDNVGFTGSPLDRADHLRSDPDVIQRLSMQPDALLLQLDGLDPVVDNQGRLAVAGFNPSSTAELALLGLLEKQPLFVELNPLATGQMANALWNVIGMLPPGEAGTYAAARSLVDWHARHRFCARCGSPTDVMRAGWGRRCPSCKAEHFPRTDPVVIMIAEHDGRALLGRQPRFPPRRYSALAGFVEVGESIEEAVARELFEEAGVRANSVNYVASQPWPFPSSLMIACVAQVESDQLTLDETELEHAFWASREDVAAALAGDPTAPFIAPPPLAIAHTLLKFWSDRR
jgi:NAD+ diphosphatase